MENRLPSKQYGVFRSGHRQAFGCPIPLGHRGACHALSRAACRTGRESTMQITVSGKQVDLSDALRTRVSTQMDTIAGKYFDHALEAHVTFSRARSFFTCDINLHAGRGLQLRGEGEAADANTAFDDAAEHIAKRLRRYRRRVNDHHRDMANRERPEAARQYILKEEVNGTETTVADGRSLDEA